MQKAAMLFAELLVNIQMRDPRDADRREHHRQILTSAEEIRRECTITCSTRSSGAVRLVR